MKDIKGFDKDFGFLSNFYPHPFHYKGESWLTSEHAYQAAKAIYEEDAVQIRLTNTPGQAKRLGQKVEKRADWEEVKLMVMEEILIAKFSDPTLKAALVGTEDAYIEETNSWNDTFWGVCAGIGENHLGKILMSIREKLCR